MMGRKEVVGIMGGEIVVRKVVVRKKVGTARRAVRKTSDGGFGETAPPYEIALASIL